MTELDCGYIPHDTPPGRQFSRLAETDDPHQDGRDDWMSAVGNIETASGLRYSFEEPDPDTVLLEDIAHALSNVCRFAGHIRRFNSVAEHSVLVSRIVEARGGNLVDVQAALLHDGHEAYIWDAPSPVKPLLGDVFKRLGKIADEVIADKFLATDGEVFKGAIIKAADRTALVVEGRALLPVGPTDAEWEPLPRGVQWDGGLSPYEAKALFLQRAKELGL
jgi:5'-nucleotidase